MTRRPRDAESNRHHAACPDPDFPVAEQSKIVGRHDSRVDADAKQDRQTSSETTQHAVEPRVSPSPVPGVFSASRGLCSMAISRRTPNPRANAAMATQDVAGDEVRVHDFRANRTQEVRTTWITPESGVGRSSDHGDARALCDEMVHVIWTGRAGLVLDHPLDGHVDGMPASWTKYR